MAFNKCLVCLWVACLVGVVYANNVELKKRQPSSESSVEDQSHSIESSLLGMTAPLANGLQEAPGEMTPQDKRKIVNDEVRNQGLQDTPERVSLF